MKSVTLLALSMPLVLALGGLAGAASGCKPKKMSQAQRCKKGCEYRLACIEEMALDRAVTEANRAVIKQRQKKEHDGYVKFCVEACNRGQKRLRGYATCGVKAKSCAAFFQCAKKVEQAEKKPSTVAPAK